MNCCKIACEPYTSSGFDEYQHSGVNYSIMTDSFTTITIPTSRVVTSAARLYSDAVRGDLAFFHFLIDTVLAGDYVAFTARRALDGAERDPEMTPTKLATTQPGGRTLFLRKNSQAMLEMFLGRLVDTFQKYLVDIIRDILRRKPEVLRTRKESLTVEELLRFATIEELVQTMIERKVSSLAYEGFGRVWDWCVDKGIPLEATPEDLPLVIEFVACRNIVAHNRGIVDARYLEAVPTTTFAIGEKRNLSVDDIFSAAELLGRIVQNSDAAAIEKFGLPTSASSPASPGDAGQHSAP